MSIFSLKGSFPSRSTPERDALILVRDQRTFRSIMSTVVLEGSNRAVFWKPTFVFEDAAPNTYQQLLAGEDQLIFKTGRISSTFLRADVIFCSRFLGQ